MLLKADTIANSLAGAAKSSDPLVIAPCPDLEDLRTSGSGAVDLRLGTWVASLRRARMAYLDTEENVESRVLKHHFIPLGSEYYLHPGHSHSERRWSGCGCPQTSAATCSGARRGDAGDS
jgi:hypothetical protein